MTAQPTIYLEEITNGAWGASFTKVLRNRLTQVLVMLVGETAEEALEDLLNFLEVKTEEERNAVLSFIVLSEKEEEEGAGEAVT